MYWATGILGLVLAVAPWIFGYSGNTVALWTSLIVGAATIIVSWIEGTQADREPWEYWTAAILGVVAIIAPFVFGFSRYTTAMWSTIVLGALIAVFAGTRLGSGGFRT
jgi:hypothetical protein